MNEEKYYHTGPGNNRSVVRYLLTTKRYVPFVVDVTCMQSLVFGWPAQPSPSHYIFFTGTTTHMQLIQHAPLILLQYKFTRSPISCLIIHMVGIPLIAVYQHSLTIAGSSTPNKPQDIQRPRLDTCGQPWPFPR